ncbi:MAG: hypothetical protein F6K14_11660 [Symploca sp. SIO2C1]|nr:hypothetical protein [Symploca sp. SIO2C1]
MPNLPEDSATYPAAVRQIDSGELAVGGDITKPPNEQLLALASRTAYLKGVSDGHDAAIANLNTALNGKQNSSATLSAIANLTLIANQFIGTDAAGDIALKSVPTISVAILQDFKSGFGGQGDTTGWLKRDLNDKQESGTSFCTLNGDSTFALPAGSYFVFARVPGTMVDKHQARLTNNTDGINYKGSSTQTLTAAAVSGQSITTDSWVFATFAIAATKTFQVEHRIYDTIIDRSLGAEVGTGMGEVYTQVVVVKLI